MTTPAPEIRIVNEWRVACDGGEGALGHPRVWYTIPKDTGYTECMYCDAKIVHKSFEDKV
ncbi:zinc-finger domain-containing protein [Yoonia sp. 208BN28-4]|uniref:zinc-finger domain-containing protein n=1 Tax=Yoonia sp. 208BN28-4 TaxID=3126505 RepID=UPI00309598A4